MMVGLQNPAHKVPESENERIVGSEEAPPEFRPGVLPHLRPRFNVQPAELQCTAAEAEAHSTAATTPEKPPPQPPPPPPPPPPLPAAPLRRHRVDVVVAGVQAESSRLEVPLGTQAPVTSDQEDTVDEVESGRRMRTVQEIAAQRRWAASDRQGPDVAEEVSRLDDLCVSQATADASAQVVWKARERGTSDVSGSRVPKERGR